ncbi:PRR11 protein, partial [Corythaeola cristata]|nr:PRR11 protein [Corythaeola cristata]
VKPFTTAASVLYCWCQNTVIQSFKVVKDTIFPSQIYLRELNTFKEQLEKLETEFSRLQGTLQMNGIAALSSESCLCQRCNKPVLGAPVQMQEGLPPAGSGPSATQLQPASAPPPPLPPPPPPLPPPKLPPAPLFLKRGNGSKALLAPSLKKDGPMQITLKDLLNVKLKKTDSNLRTDKVSSFLFSCFVFLEKNRELIIISLVSNLFRSPGGTPLNSKENMECGSGLTPIMTQALRRKFQASHMAHPKSPSPARLSAANSFDE